MSSILGVLLLVTSAMALPQLAFIPVEPCTSNSECPPNFCCLLGPSRYAIPTCKPLQQKSEQCRVNADTITTNLTYPDNSRLELKDVNFILCDCNDGLSCDSKRGICD